MQVNEIRQERFKIVPIALLFAEERTEYEAPSRDYSEEKQRGIFEPADLLNPLYMSPTVFHTQGGDKQGDESY